MLKKISLAAALTVSVSGLAIAAPQGGNQAQGGGHQGSSSVVAPAPKAMQKGGDQGQQQSPQSLPHQVPASQSGAHHHGRQAPKMGSGGHQHQRQASASQVQAPKININKASASTLSMLPNVSSKQAKAIVSYRKNHDLKSVSDLSKVKGIDKKTMNSIKNFKNVLTTGHSKKSGNKGKS